MQDWSQQQQGQGQKHCQRIESARSTRGHPAVHPSGLPSVALVSAEPAATHFTADGVLRMVAEAGGCHAGSADGHDKGESARFPQSSLVLPLSISLLVCAPLL
jgi:hypothetical protein